MTLFVGFKIFQSYLGTTQFSLKKKNWEKLQLLKELWGLCKVLWAIFMEDVLNKNAHLFNHF